MERPIIFSANMVQAILAGRKTQTRRIVKPQPDYVDEYAFRFTEFFQAMSPPKSEVITCPYGTPGDLLWVRETFSFYMDAILFKADEPHVFKGIKYKPSIHMPKDYARIWLEITNIRIEKLNDITQEDAIAEGIEKYPDDATNFHYRNYNFDGLFMMIPKYSFKSLWEIINGNDSWDANPWVWVISFKVLSTTGKPFNPSTLDSASAAKQPKPSNS